MKRVFTAYRELLSILFAESPFIVIAVFASAALAGAASPLLVWTSSQILNTGMLVAAGGAQMSALAPFLVAFVGLTLVPVVVGDMFTYSYLEPRCMLILRTAFKGKMLQKLKKLRYEHLESTQSMEIIDKAYNRAENSAQHLFPMYVNTTVNALVAIVGTLWLLGSVKWWLVLTILLPFALQTWLDKKFFFNIYDQMEKYWKDERQYEQLGKMLRSRDYLRENSLFGASGFLINTYRRRMNARNRDYERYYLSHLRRNFTRQNIIKLAQIGNAALLLWLYTRGELSIGLLIPLTLAIFTDIFSWGGLMGMTIIFRWGGFHAKTFEFYDKYFALSEDEYGETDGLPDDFSIEFDNVHFKYPGAENPVLSGLSLSIKHGERVSIVGQNGEGKTTMIKLLLGLFQPDSGEIRIGGVPLSEYSQSVRTRLFGPVFQDFVRYSISFAENIGVGDIGKIDDQITVSAAMHKANAVSVAENLPQGTQTLLGRDFEGAVDLSGGQWQRVAIARAFMGDKPILILDEPTSQLDPMAESQIYSEFAEMSRGKTAIFITHRLGSTVITDRIFVVSGGRVTQSGTHDELLCAGGLYADMFNSQKQWYIKGDEK